MKKKSINEVKLVFNSIGLELLDEEYKDVDTPLKCRDKNGYLFARSLRSVGAETKRPVEFNKSFSTKNKYYWENVQYFMQNRVETGTKLLSSKEQFVNSDAKLSFLCGACGAEYKTSWRNFVRVENKICPKCFREQKLTAEYVEQRRNSIYIYKNKAAEKNITLLSENIRSCKDKVDVQDIDGYRGRMTASRLLSSSSFERFSVRNPYTLYNIRLFLSKNGSECFVYDQQFKGTSYQLKLRCSCGNDFSTTLDHLVAGKDKCNECRVKQSCIAQLVEEWLKINNLCYIKEKTFAGCYGVKRKLLQFDFYLPDYQCCIEVDGLQHYKPILWHGITKEEAENNFNTIKQNDNIKNDFCVNNNIVLIRLPFWKIEKSTEYKSVLEQFFFPTKSSELS